MGIIGRIQDFFDGDGKNFRKGDQFEKLTSRFFPDFPYDSLEMTHSSKTNRERVVESPLKPDFKFRGQMTYSLTCHNNNPLKRMLDNGFSQFAAVPEGSPRLRKLLP